MPSSRALRQSSTPAPASGVVIRRRRQQVVVRASEAPDLLPLPRRRKRLPTLHGLGVREAFDTIPDLENVSSSPHPPGVELERRPVTLVEDIHDDQVRRIRAEVARILASGIFGRDEG